MKIFKKSGFSLMELMITIAIIGIVSAVAAPNFIHYMAERRLNGAARMVMSDLMSARQKAVSHNNNFKIFFNANQREYTILDDDNNDGSITASPSEATEVRDIGKDYYDVTLSNPDQPANSPTNPIFYPRGTAFGTTVKLTSARTGTSKYVKVASTGRVKIDDSP
jgi:type IV fimbrial biogenesis protein FimT